MSFYERVNISAILFIFVSMRTNDITVLIGNITVLYSYITLILLQLVSFY